MIYNHYISHRVLLLEEEEEEELVPSEDVEDTDPSSLELEEVLLVIDVPSWTIELTLRCRTISIADSGERTALFDPNSLSCF